MLEKSSGLSYVVGVGDVCDNVEGEFSLKKGNSKVWTVGE